MNVSKLKYRLKQSLFFYCLLLVVGVYAQRYPVQVTQTIIPPYSTKLSDYATASDVKFRLNLLLTDVVANNKQVRLKLHIKGNGFDIQSTDFVTGASQVILNGGVLQQFTNIDLAAYFQPNNLIGISPQQYNKPLPEGMYSFCWEVYDAYTNQQLNHPTAGCSNVYLLLNDPPFLNLPYKGDQIVAQDPMNIIFQWTPRHTNATNVSYEFELRELWDTQVDPQAAFLASPNYYSETTYTTTLLYNTGKPTLLPNRRYGWRVKAKSTTGVSENSIFKNDGYSEIYYFTYTNACYSPTFVLSEVVAKDRIKLTWQGHPDHKKYHVQYKRADIPDAEWFEIYTYNTQAQISNLRTGKTYMFRVGGTCNELTDFDQNYSYSHMSQFTMPAKDEMGSSYNCGIIPEIQIDNNDPLKNIGINETFTAGDFPVTVKQIQGGNGTFTGVGYIVVPYLGDTKIAVTFDAISINTDYQLIEGVVKTTYDPTWGDVEDTNDWTQGGTGNSESTEVDFPVSDVQIDPNGDILVIGENGEVVELPGGEDIVITDSNGQVWAVDEEGNVTPQGTQAEGGASNPENTNGVNTNGQATAISAKGVIVTFKKASNSKYGFDSYESNYSATKDLYKKLGNNYYVPYKAVAKNDTETIVANLAITDSKIKPQDIVFKTKDGVAITKIDSTATSYTLELKGVFDDAEIETQALVKQGTKYEVAGAFIQYQATPKNVKVVVVNTSNTSARTIKESLQNIYQQAMVNLTITEINDFKNDLEALTPDGTIQSGESGFAAQYTEQQRQINNKLKQHSQYQQDAYYLIVTDKTPSFASEKGLMPLGRQFGYVYTTNCSTADCVALTAAHELGHGAFQLKHPFSSQSYQYAQKATNWLLDYKDGTKLPFVHWQTIHNPKLRIGVFDRDSEGEYTDAEYFEKLLQQIRCAYIDGKNSIPLPSKFKNKAKDGEVFKFSYGASVEKGVINGDKISLASVKTENKEIISNITSPKFINNSQIEFGGITLKFTTPSYAINNGITPWEHLTKYLFPKDEQVVKEEYQEVLNQLLNKTTFTDNDIKSLKRIASCGARYFSTKNKYRIIKKIVEFSTFEYYEDLVLDLIENYDGDVTTYSNELLSYLDNDSFLLKVLFNKIDDKKFWKGNEDNFTRFLEVLHGLWVGSKYAKKDNYSYVDIGDTFDATKLSPEFISYDGSSWFPKVSYSNTSFQKGKFTMSTETIYGKHGQLEYEYFQPVYLGFIKGNNIKLTKVEVPAIYFAGTVKKDNLEKSLDQIGLTLDVALTLSAIGNVAKLRHLTTLQKIGRITIASVEVTSGFADIMVRYSDLCQGNEAFCKTFQEYNTYLQLGLLGSGLIRAKFSSVRNNAKEEYIKHRETLVDKYGESDVSINELDGHFGLVNEGDGVLASLKGKLKLSEAQWKKFETDFKNNTTALKKFEENPKLAKSWEVLLTSTRRSDLKWVDQMDKWLDLGVQSEVIDNIIHFTAPNGFKFAKIKGNKLYYNYDGFGGDILVTPDKVTTVLGKFFDPPKFGTSVYLDKTKTGLENGIISRVVNKRPPNNSIAFLDLPEDQYNSLLNGHIKDNILSSPLFKGDQSKLDLIDGLDPWSDQVKDIISNKILPNASKDESLSILKKGINDGNEAFWHTYNKIFLEKAFQRGDDIRLVSDPKIYQPDPVKGGSYKRELDAITGSEGLAKKYGYYYDNATKTYYKK
ncbi:hypothetical protein [Tenacibaculum mesophilum]|uniref:fibronectin type III domain-containing protein n=1 Tax=Tenacibaculum mesophilum TaxID=104268 RepID=UPI003F63DD62